MACVEKPMLPGVWASEREGALGEVIKLHSGAVVNWSKGQMLGKSVRGTTLSWKVPSGQSRRKTECSRRDLVTKGGWPSQWLRAAIHSCLALVGTMEGGFTSSMKI